MEIFFRNVTANTRRSGVKGEREGKRERERGRERERKVVNKGQHITVLFSRMHLQLDLNTSLNAC
jgi:hypothetical protein